MTDELLEELLSKPVGPHMAGRMTMPEDFTREVVVTATTATITATVDEGEVGEADGLQFLEDESLHPDDWEATGFSKSRWGTEDAPMESVRFTYKRRQSASKPLLDDEWLNDALSDYEAVSVRPVGSHGYLVLIGDMQFGKIDGDSIEGTVFRTLDCLTKAAAALAEYRLIYDIGHVHIAWLGDHIEGFVSQGGANAWRTRLTLSEQIRLTRRVMLYAMELFAPLAETVTMVAVPGNHGETIRFEGKGLTRYDDSHDTESLIAVMDAAALMPDAFGHVKFFVPDTDEMTVLVEVAGTNIAHAHGHKWSPNKHFLWWQGQAFNRDSAMHVADLLCAGHLHHEHIEADGNRTFIGVPAMESESTWWRHSKGTGGAPGLIVAITKDGRTPVKHLIT